MSYPGSGVPPNSGYPPNAPQPFNPLVPGVAPHMMYPPQMMGYPPTMMMPPHMIPPYGNVAAPNMFVPPISSPTNIEASRVQPSSKTTNKSSADDWIEYKTPTGQPYYYNKVTQVTQWTKPQEIIDAEQRTSPNGVENHWTEYIDQNTGKPYYYNSVTRKSEWIMPPEYKEWKERQKSAKTQPSNSPQVNAPKTTTVVEKSTKHDESTTEPPRSRSPVMSKTEAVRIFKELLEETGVDSDWDWNRTMKKIANDERYKVLKSMQQKKDVFSEYMDEKRAKDREERHQRERKGRHDFMQMLSELTDLTPRTNYHSIVPKLENDPRFQAVREFDRQRFFEDHLQLLEKKEREEMHQKREHYMTQFRAMLEQKAEQGVINASSVYRKITDLIENEESYQALDNHDRYKVWEIVKEELQHKEEERKAQERAQRKKQEKENRAVLWDLFLALKKDNKIDVLSSWKEVKPLVCEEKAYKDVEANSSGPYSKKLFNEFLGELEKQYKKDKKLFKTIMKENKLSISPDTNYNEWHLQISKDERLKQLDSENVKILFEESVDKSKQRIKKRKRAAEKFIRAAEDTILHHKLNLEEVTYEMLLRFMFDKPAWERVRSEEERRQLVDKAIKNLREPPTLESNIEKRKREDETVGNEEEPPQKRLKSNEEEIQKVKADAIPISNDINEQEEKSTTTTTNS
jgi:pre-mRNA-processing factor 40